MHLNFVAMYQLLLNAVLAAAISARFYRDWVLSVEHSVLLASVLPFLGLLHFTTELEPLGRFLHWSTLLPFVALVFVFYVNDDNEGLVVGSSFLAMWVYYDAWLSRQRPRSLERRTMLPLVLALLVWSMYNVYESRFIPWGTVWMPSLVVLAYLTKRFVIGLVSSATKETPQDDFASVLFVVIIAYALLARPRAVTECMEADDDACGFGSSLRGKGVPISNGCKCLTKEWLPVVSDTDTGGVFDICLRCGANHTQRPGTDCCGVPLTTKLIGLLNCIENKRDQCACGTASNTVYNNETESYSCLY